MRKLGAHTITEHTGEDRVQQDGKMDSRQASRQRRKNYGKAKSNSISEGLSFFL